MLRVLDRIALRFESAGVPVMALKGAVINLTIHGPHDQRPMDDLDLLVRESDVSRACAVLTSIGGVPGSAPVREDFFPRYHYEMEYGIGRIFPVRIDLHVRPFRPLRYSRTVPGDALWESARRLRIDGGSVLIPSDEGMLIHLATHAAVHGCARRTWLVDLQQWTMKRRAGINWNRFVDTAERWRLTVPVREALARAESELGAFLPADVLPRLARTRANWRDRLALRQAPRDAERPVRHVLVSAVTTPGLRFVLGYVWRAVVPNRAHMASWYGRRHRGWLTTAHLMRWFRPLVRRRAVVRQRRPGDSRHGDRTD